VNSTDGITADEPGLRKAILRLADVLPPCNDQDPDIVADIRAAQAAMVEVDQDAMDLIAVVAQARTKP
jgi:hypothetical protein